MGSIAAGIQAASSGRVACCVVSWADSNRRRDEDRLLGAHHLFGVERGRTSPRAQLMSSRSLCGSTFTRRNSLSCEECGTGKLSAEHVAAVPVRMESRIMDGDSDRAGLARAGATTRVHAPLTVAEATAVPHDSIATTSEVRSDASLRSRWRGPTRRGPDRSRARPLRPCARRGSRRPGSGVRPRDEWPAPSGRTRACAISRLRS